MSLDDTIITGVIFERAATCGIPVLSKDGEDERLQIDRYGRKMLRMARKKAILPTDTDEHIATKLTAGFWLFVASMFVEQIAPQLLAWIIAAMRKRLWPTESESRVSER